MAKPRPIWLYPFAGEFLLARFLPTSLWSLRLSETTSSGGKTCVCPTPYSLKLALIDALIQATNQENGERLFRLLRGRPLRVRPPAQAVVSGLLVKIRKRERPEGAVDRSLVRMFEPTMGYREYVHFHGDADESLLSIAIQSAELAAGDRALIASAVHALCYSGKRGGFLRFVPAPSSDGLSLDRLEAASPYTIPLSQASEGFLLGSIQLLDELSAIADWSRVSTFGPENLRVCKEVEWDSKGDRVFVPTSVPYRLVGSSRSFVHYRRSDWGQVAG